MTLVRLIGAATIATGLTVSAAAALTHTGTGCKDTSVISASGPLECSGIWEGNDNQDLVDENGNPLFGIVGWEEILKLDASSGTETDGDMTLTVTNHDRGGDWSLTGYDDYESLMFVLKGGDAFSAFLVDPEDTELAGTWDDASMHGDLSHWTVYGVLEDVAEAPLPAAGLLLLGGVGAMVAFGRRRRKD